MSQSLIDIGGQRFGRLSVLEYLGRDYGWKCRCDCGTEKLIQSGNIRSGKVISCGCAHSNELSYRNTVHGQRRTALYRTWSNMKARCENVRSAGYPRYGGRGIKVCERWASFSAFASDMGAKPSLEHSIDRINCDGDYEPRNCRWATRKEQMANTTRNVFVVVDGERMIQAEAARRTGVTVGTLKHRQRMKAMQWL